MDDELRVVDEAVALYKGPKAKNRDVLQAMLTDLAEWAGERGFDLREELDRVYAKRSA